LGWVDKKFNKVTGWIVRHTLAAGTAYAAYELAPVLFEAIRHIVKDIWIKL